MIPKIDVKADYSSLESFTYNYQGYPYWFNATTSSSGINYTFDSSVLDYVIKTGADALQVNLANDILGIKITNFSQTFVNAIYSLVYNARVALGKFIADWFAGSSVNACYAWQMYLLDIDESYPGHETYGPAYGWRFEGIFGEDIDIVLDQFGDFYGSNEIPIGNYTFVDLDDEIEWISVHQMNPSEDVIYTPEYYGHSFHDLKEPYIDGKSLYFYLYKWGTAYKVRLDNFVNTYIAIGYSDSNNRNRIYFYSPDANSDNYYSLTNIDGYPYYSFNNINYRMYLNNSEISARYCELQFYRYGDSNNLVDHTVLPNNYFGLSSYPYFSTAKTLNSAGIYNQYAVIESTPRIFLQGLSYTPVADPVEIPTDVPIPIGDIPEDPTDFDPDPSDDPDPVPGAPYTPTPEPDPVPPIPPIVSGNDDLWPDVNDLIAAEDSLGEYTFAIRNFEWPDFSNLMGDYLSPLIWVSTIITTLFNGTPYSIIFSVLSLMFVVAALLGILKGWTSRDG